LAEQRMVTKRIHARVVVRRDRGDFGMLDRDGGLTAESCAQGARTASGGGWKGRRRPWLNYGSRGSCAAASAGDGADALWDRIEGGKRRSLRRRVSGSYFGRWRRR
jgi:hypothetical protein